MMNKLYDIKEVSEKVTVVDGIYSKRVYQIVNITESSKKYGFVNNYRISVYLNDECIFVFRTKTYEDALKEINNCEEEYHNEEFMEWWY